MTHHCCKSHFSVFEQLQIAVKTSKKEYDDLSEFIRSLRMCSKCKKFHKKKLPDDPINILEKKVEKLKQKIVSITEENKKSLKEHLEGKKKQRKGV